VLPPLYRDGPSTAEGSSGSKRGRSSWSEWSLIILLVLLIIGALPTWSHSRSWGYFPSGGLVILLIVGLVLLSRGGGKSLR